MKKLAILALVASCVAAPASAQQCVSLDRAAQIIDSAGMEKVSSGRVPDGAVVTYANPNTGQFIVTLETASASCLIVTGDSFTGYGFGVPL